MTTSEENEKLLEFLTLLLQVNEGNPYKIDFSNESMTTYQEVQRMLVRILEGKIPILPYHHDRSITWMILSKDETMLKQHGQELTKYLNLYGKLRHKPDFGNQTPMRKLAGESFPHGCFMLTTSKDKEADMWKQLALWCHVDERRPPVDVVEQELNASVLRSQFHESVALQHFEEAQAVLTMIRSGHYLSDENTLFLKIQLLGAQQKWQELWGSPDFATVAGLEVIPIRIKALLLQAFYFSILADTDEQLRYEQSMRYYEQYRPQLQTLIRSQLGLDGDVVLRVFAYEAFGQRRADKLERYLERSRDVQTQAILQFFLDKLTQGTQADSDLDTDDLETKALQYFQQRQYEDAFLILLDSPSSKSKAFMLCQIATMIATEEYVKVAYQAYLDLPKVDQEALMQDPQSKPTILVITHWTKGNVRTPSEGIGTGMSDTWHDWFSAFLADRSIDELEERMNRIPTSSGITWTLKILGQLAEQLEQIALGQLTSSQKIMLHQALPSFFNALMESDNFPYASAMEVYYASCLVLALHGRRSEVNTEYLLRLTEGLFYLDMTRVDDYWGQIEEWFAAQPTVKNLPNLLWTLELFQDYGLDTAKAKAVWDHWSGTLSNALERVESSLLNAWTDVGKFVGGDYNLLQSFEEVLEKTDEADPIAKATAQVVTIFSLREETARRAMLELMERNPAWKVRICTDSCFTSEAKSYATSSDIAVVVTTCMSHAMTYGIMPILRQRGIAPVYPRSSGKLAIVYALEQYLVGQTG